MNNLPEKRMSRFGLQFRLEYFPGGEVKDRGRGTQVLLNHENAPGAVKTAQGERPLHSRHLVVVKLHGIDRAAAKLVILGVRTEYGREEDTSTSPFRVARQNRMNGQNRILNVF